MTLQLGARWVEGERRSEKFLRVRERTSNKAITWSAKCVGRGQASTATTEARCDKDLFIFLLLMLTYIVDWARCKVQPMIHIVTGQHVLSFIH